MTDAHITKVWDVDRHAMWFLTESMFRGVAVYDEPTKMASADMIVRAWRGQQPCAYLLRTPVQRIRIPVEGLWFDYTLDIAGVECDYAKCRRGPLDSNEVIDNPHWGG